VLLKFTGCPEASRASGMSLPGRGVGTIEPLWNLFDFTREGRPANWHEQFSY
jgi:predicted dithiol-disulfide oxidoreductase (DUF899 family)